VKTFHLSIYSSAAPAAKVRPPDINLSGWQLLDCAMPSFSSERRLCGAADVYQAANTTSLSSLFISLMRYLLLKLFLSEVKNKAVHSLHTVLIFQTPVSLTEAIFSVCVCVCFPKLECSNLSRQPYLMPAAIT